MAHQTAEADEILQQAIDVLQTPAPGILAALDEIPQPIYVTDTDGLITHYNQACIAFAGRRPLPGDHWCVTWKLYTEDGDFLPHDQCPMAEAIREKRAVRDVAAIAERPDGSRVRFHPYPTPLLNAQGEMVGAINMLIEVSDRKHASSLRAQADRCRRLAGCVDDRQTTDTLNSMADAFEAKALKLDRAH